MRQGQPQNRQRSRGRGNNNNRNNNNRNQLNRSMESNGPDVRIRGTASHIAEKYMQLARDAQSAGDNVAAESYWQHAEHYNRLIAVAQAAQQQQRDEQRAQQQSNEDSDAESSQSNSEGDENNGRNRGRGRRQRPHDAARTEEAESAPNGAGPQPVLESTPAEVALKEQPVVAEADAPEETPPARTRRPRKKAEPATPAAETPNELPAFISGVAEE